jgi:hypothetical protein
MRTLSISADFRSLRYGTTYVFVMRCIREAYGELTSQRTRSYCPLVLHEPRYQGWRNLQR